MLAQERFKASSGRVAEWLCSGLQIRVRRFNSDLGLQYDPISIEKSPAYAGLFCAGKLAPSLGGETGIRSGLKIRRGRPHAGSSPAPGTTLQVCVSRANRALSSGYGMASADNGADSPSRRKSAASTADAAVGRFGDIRARAEATHAPCLEFGGARQAGARQYVQRQRGACSHGGNVVASGDARNEQSIGAGRTVQAGARQSLLDAFGSWRQSAQVHVGTRVDEHVGALPGAGAS